MSNTASSHSIRLRGPWQVSLRDSLDTECWGKRINVREDADWQSWRSDSQLIEYLNNECGHSIVSISFRRRFNWLAPEPTPQSVELRIKGAVPVLLLLNGDSISVATFDDGCGAQVLELLKPSNELILNYEFSPAMQPMELLGASLEIVEAA